MTVDAIISGGVWVMAALLAIGFLLPEKFQNLKPLFYFSSLLGAVLNIGLIHKISASEIVATTMDELLPILNSYWVLMVSVLSIVVLYFAVVFIIGIKEGADDLAEDFRRS